MPSPTLHFGVYFGSKRVKKLSAKTVDTICKMYNAYCKSKGFVQRYDTNESFGFMAWMNPFNGNYLVLRRE